MDQSFEYIGNTSTFCSLASYPYEARTYPICRVIKCAEDSDAMPGTVVTGYRDVAISNDALLSALKEQPVSIALDADPSVFQHYACGIISGPCDDKSIDHGVLAVGFSSDDSGKQYFRVKNSWSKGWGESGYFRIARQRRRRTVRHAVLLQRAAACAAQVQPQQLLQRARECLPYALPRFLRLHLRQRSVRPALPI
jgi:KDEL-tailed cysteine endopeptidase